MNIPTIFFSKIKTINIPNMCVIGSSITEKTNKQTYKQGKLHKQQNWKEVYFSCKLRA